MRRKMRRRRRKRMKRRRKRGGIEDGDVQCQALHVAT